MTIQPEIKNEMSHFFPQRHLRLLEWGGEVKMAGRSGEVPPGVKAAEPATW